MTKSEAFKAMVKAGMYRWTGDTYEMVRIIEESEEENEEKPKVIKPRKIWKEDMENDKTPTIDQWIDSQPGYEELKKRLENLRRENWEKDDDEYENDEEKDIKSPEIPSSFQYSGNSNKSELEK